MTWLLTILMISPDGTAVQTRAGLMISEEVCDLAGAGISTIVLKEDPALFVAWSCVAQVSA